MFFILSWFYRQQLRLYPRSFRDEFGEELLAVYDQVLQDGRQEGGWGALFRFLRELRDLPGVLLRLHSQRWRASSGSLSFPEPSGPTPWRVALLSLLPLFFVGPVSGFVSYHPWWEPEQWPWVFPLFGVAASLSICAGFILGAIRRFPRWSYPYAIYLVFLATFLSTYVINHTPWDINHEGGILFLVVAVAVSAAGLVPGLRPFWTNLRRDWTLLSYGLYACTLFLLSTQDQDEAPTLNFLVMLPSLVAIVGALIHLRLASSRGRMGVLFLSMLLGVFLWLIPVFDGMTGSREGSFQVMSLMLTVWGILGSLLLAPIAISFFAGQRRVT